MQFSFDPCTFQSCFSNVCFNLGFYIPRFFSLSFPCYKWNYTSCYFSFVDFCMLSCLSFCSKFLCFSCSSPQQLGTIQIGLKTKIVFQVVELLCSIQSFESRYKPPPHGGLQMKGAEHQYRCNMLYTTHYTKHSVIVRREVDYTRL